MNRDKPEPKKLTLGQMVRMNQLHRSWKKFEPEWKMAVRQNTGLGLLARDASFAHFLGGCSSHLQDFGTITRRDFLRLLTNATEFAQHIDK